MNRKKQHCCHDMAFFLEEKKVCIGYIPKFREYYINLHKQYAVQGIQHCPWCGTKLPDSLSDIYFTVLREEYTIEDDVMAEEKGLLPEEFKTDEWWNKRNL